MKFIHIIVCIVSLGSIDYIYSEIAPKGVAAKSSKPISSSSKPVVAPRYTQLPGALSSTGAYLRPSSPVVGSGVTVNLKPSAKSTTPISDSPSLSLDASAPKPAPKNPVTAKYVQEGDAYFLSYSDGVKEPVAKSDYDRFNSNQTRNKYTKTLGGRLGGIAFNVSTVVKNFFTISPEFKAQTSQVLSSVGNKVSSLFLPSSATGKNSAKVTPLAGQEGAGISSSSTSGPTTSRQAENAFLHQFKVGKDGKRIDAPDFAEQAVESPNSKVAEEKFLKDFTRGEDGKRGTSSISENDQYFSNLPAVDTPAAKATGASPEVYKPLMNLSSSRSAGAKKPASNDPWSSELTASDKSGNVSRDSHDFSDLYL